LCSLYVKAVHANILKPFNSYQHINLLQPVNLKFRRPNQLIKKKPEKNLLKSLIPYEIFQLEESLNSAQNPMKIALYSHSSDLLDLYPSDLRIDPVSFYLKIYGSPITALEATNRPLQGDSYIIVIIFFSNLLIHI